MQLTFYQVDNFTDKLFSGNPAAVCPLASWLPTNLMQNIAAENNLSETAFLYAIMMFLSCVGLLQILRLTFVAMQR
jgi:PhzF family phenazine biosynthesis protein